MVTEGYKLRMVGGSLVVTIPQGIAREFYLKAGDYVTFDTEDGVITIDHVGEQFPKKRKPKAKGRK